MVENPSEWVIKVTFQDGASRYYCGNYYGRPWKTDRGSAIRYESEFEAITDAYKLKGTNSRIAEVEAEEIKNPRKRF